MADIKAGHGVQIKGDEHGEARGYTLDGMNMSADDSNCSSNANSNMVNSNHTGIDERINAVVVRHISSVVGEHTLKVINYHINRMGADIYNVCTEPKRVEDALYSLFKESSRLLIAEVINALYMEFGILDGRDTTLEGVVRRIKSLC